MRSRVIHAKIWKDDFFANLSESEKLLFIYYLTNEHITIIHLYECSNREAMFDTGIAEDKLINARNKFQAEKKIYFYKDFIYIANASRYQDYKGPTNDIAKANLLKQLPLDVLNWYYNLNDTSIHTSQIPSKTITITKSKLETKLETKVNRGYEDFRKKRKELGLLKKFN